MKDVAYYRGLPYRRRVERREEGERHYFLAWVQELPSIEIHGATHEEALLHLDEIFDDCIQVMLEAGETIPEPELWPADPDVAQLLLPAEPGSVLARMIDRFLPRKEPDVAPAAAEGRGLVVQELDEAKPWQTGSREYQTA